MSIELPVIVNRRFDEMKRRRIRVYQMVAELHKIGYQGLRVSPQIHHQRIHLTPSIFCTEVSCHGMCHFMTIIKWELLEKSMAAVYYGHEVEGRNARDAANDFIRKFPVIAEMSLREDHEYAGWYSRLTGEIEKGLEPWSDSVIKTDLFDIEFDDSKIREYASGTSLNVPISEPFVALTSVCEDARDPRNLGQVFPPPPLPRISTDEVFKFTELLLVGLPNVSR